MKSGRLSRYGLINWRLFDWEIDIWFPSRGAPFAYFSRHAGGLKVGLLWGQAIINRLAR